MNALRTFNHEMFGQVRTMTNERGETFFVGKDVAEALGYKNTADAIIKHVDKEDRSTIAIRDSAYETRAVVINESGLYSLILSSKLEQAKAFNPSDGNVLAAPQADRDAAPPDRGTGTEGGVLRRGARQRELPDDDADSQGAVDDGERPDAPAGAPEGDVQAVGTVDALRRLRPQGVRQEPHDRAP